MNNPATSKDRYIPAPVKREVRYKCRFGCVICGHPIVHYDHIIPYAKVKEHTPDNIVLLCPNHHQEKTSGRISIDQVKRFSDEPILVKKSWSNPYHSLLDRSDDPVFLFGSNRFHLNKDGRPHIIVFSLGIPIITARYLDGMVCLDCNFYRKNGDREVVIKSNEIFYRNDFWDIDWVGQKLTIRSGLNKIHLKLKFDRNQLHLHHLNTFARGHLIRIRNQGGTLEFGANKDVSIINIEENDFHDDIALFGLWNDDGKIAQSVFPRTSLINKY